MTILRATITDLADATLLLREYYESIQVQKRDSPEEIAAYLAEPASALWLAYEDGIPAGCVALRPLPLPVLPPGSATECKRLYVRPEFRGRHIAGALLEALEQHSAALGAHWVYLDSNHELTDAIRLYLHREYEPCPRYNSDPQATVFFRKELITALKKP